MSKRYDRDKRWNGSLNRLCRQYSCLTQKVTAEKVRRGRIVQDNFAWACEELKKEKVKFPDGWEIARVINTPPLSPEDKSGKDVILTLRRERISLNQDKIIEEMDLFFQVKNHRPWGEEEKFKKRGIYFICIPSHMNRVQIKAKVLETLSNILNQKERY